MDQQHSSEVKASQSAATDTRRKFLTRASAGAVLLSIPGRSAWAGIAGSIVASGHGSDWNQGQCTQLLSHGYWKTHTENWPVLLTTTFFDAFGGEPIEPADNASGKTLLQVLDKSGNKPGEGLGGPSNVNTHMAAMYLTAAHFDANPNANSLGIFYPAVQQHGSLAAYGRYLYSQASAAPSSVGVLLNNTIANYHVGVVCI